MSLTARTDTAAYVLEKLVERLSQDVSFDRDSTAFDMGIQQERRNILIFIEHHSNQRGALYDPKSRTYRPT
jgi:hypothetical protein